MKKLFLFAMLMSGFFAVAQEKETATDIKGELTTRCFDVDGVLYFQELKDLGEQKSSLCYRYKCVVKDKNNVGPQGNLIAVNEVKVLCRDGSEDGINIDDKYRDWKPEAKETKRKIINNVREIKKN